MGIQLVDSLAAIEAPLNFTQRSAARPARYVDKPKDGNYANAAEDDRQVVTVRNARPILDQLSLDVQGFAVLRRPSAVTDFYDPAQIRDIYYLEVEEQMREATGAAHVIAFDHNIRNGGAGIHKNERGIRGPAKRVHNDYTLDSGPRRARAAAAGAGGRAPQAPLRPDQPVASAQDRRGGAAGDLRRALDRAERLHRHRPQVQRPHRRDLLGRPQPGAPLVLRAAHDPDEAMLLKCYDSASHVARFTAHGAFDDPTAPANAAPRESIEVRTLLY
jgi:hypothetical protein